MDGQWPDVVHVDCTWEGGRCRLVAQAARGSGHSYTGDVALRISNRAQTLLWINVRLPIAEAKDGALVGLNGFVSLSKRKSESDPTLGARMNSAIKQLVASSGLPIVRASHVKIGDVEIPSGDVLPTAESAFRHALHLALYKLDFMDGSPEAVTARGRPLVDVPGLLETATVDPDEEDDDDEETDGNEGGPRAQPRYWAGGFKWGEVDKLDEFRAGSYWQIGWSRSDTTRAAETTWRQFEAIRPGDWFAIKGLGGTHDLVVHMVGRVVTVDADAGRLTFEPVDGPRYRGKAPKGPGAGNWFDTLVPVTRPEDIATIFGRSAAVVARERVPPPPLNLLLYGPPGTGKTYRLQTWFAPQFTRRDEAPDLAADLADELTWTDAIALALHLRGGSGRVDDLLDQPLLKAKHAAQGIKTPLRQIVWGNLGQHAVERSETVRMTRRWGDLLFDKQGDGTWFLAEELPPHLQDHAARLRKPAPAAEVLDYTFTTFHQAYGYEDFIEGIRPELAERESGDAQLRYVLMPGVLKTAAQAALRLTSFKGSLDEVCRLPRHQRRALFENVPRYAIFIDEINRGNVARVFGELISLLEPDKRLGAANELIVTLPYSRSFFGVPANLHLIGTMNTADRSVEALDTALRRRFQFEELPPRPELLEFVIDGLIDPRAMLRTINQRLEKLYDRDHVIGHAYFQALQATPTLSALKDVFKRAVLPLLQEYFFGDFGKIGLVLGRDFVRRRDPAAAAFASFDHEEHELLAQRTTWEIVDVDTLSSLAFRRIYEDVPEDA